MNWHLCYQSYKTLLILLFINSFNFSYNVVIIGFILNYLRNFLSFVTE
jgi:hypothetical protein